MRQQDGCRLRRPTSSCPVSPPLRIPGTFIFLPPRKGALNGGTSAEGRTKLLWFAPRWSRQALRVAKWRQVRLNSRILRPRCDRKNGASSAGQRSGLAGGALVQCGCPMPAASATADECDWWPPRPYRGARMMHPPTNGAAPHALVSNQALAGSHAAAPLPTPKSRIEP